MPRLPLFLLLFAVLLPVPLQAQPIPLEQALADASVQQGLARIDESAQLSARSLVHIGGIISPSGQEHERAGAVAQMMREIGLSDVEVTAAPNAVGRIPGRSGQALVFVSTLDDLATVAEHQRAADGPPVIDGERVVGPGTNTSLTTVAMLSAARALLEQGWIPEHDLVFAAVAEEETGLQGMKALYDEYRERAFAFVDILGEGSGISYGALGIHWWRVHAEGPAGHTLNGGLPNVNQGIGRAVDRILQIEDPRLYDHRRTRLNVAMLSSGAVFNHKPETGWFSLDIRSLDPEHIESMEQQVRQILADVTDELRISFRMEPFSMMPPGQIEGARDSDLVQTSLAISDYLGSSPTLSDAGSANLNVAIAGGTLAIGISSERGGQRGFADEWASVEVMQRTAKNVFLTAVTMGGGALMLGRTILGVSALVFIAYGLVSLISPAIPAGFAGIEMSNGDAFAEVGAMYGGLQTGIGMFCLLAFLRPGFYQAGLALLAIGIGAMTLARLLSLLVATDAISAYTYGALIYEFVTALVAAIALVKK